MLGLIFENTNKSIELLAKNYSRAKEVRLTNKAEIQALLGLLYYSGTLKTNHLTTDESGEAIFL